MVYPGNILLITVYPTEQLGQHSSVLLVDSGNITSSLVHDITNIPSPMADDDGSIPLGQPFYFTAIREKDYQVNTSSLQNNPRLAIQLEQVLQG